MEWAVCKTPLFMVKSSGVSLFTNSYIKVKIDWLNWIMLEKNIWTLIKQQKLGMYTIRTVRITINQIKHHNYKTSRSFAFILTISQDLANHEFYQSMSWKWAD